MSSPINPEFVERYQLEYQKNPRSRVFAPLAEAYRKMGLLDEAHRICSAGVKIHPEFAGGRVALAKVLIARKQPEDAFVHLEKAVQLSPDNLLAHSLLGETLLELRRPKDALKAFKMVLFINPNDEKALAAVRKWEFLTADEYDAELFRLHPLFDKAAVAERKNVERALSLADAYTVRNEVERAIEVLESARADLESNPEINHRLSLLQRRTRPSENTEPQRKPAETVPEHLRPISGRAKPSGVASMREKKQQILERLLQRIKDRRVPG